MPKPWSSNEMYRTHLDDYAERWSEYFTLQPRGRHL